VTATRVASRSFGCGAQPLLSSRPFSLGQLGRRDIEALTQQLLDALIEIMDLVDGDADQEGNADDLEDDDGL
jgi:hypothetical protein